jgi:two-component system nitrogen regulation response regulator GlnG
MMSQLDETTRRPRAQETRDRGASRLLLTVAFHPSLRRIGERAELGPLTPGRSVQLSRRTPDLRTPDGRIVGPLADPFISRGPLLLQVVEGGDVVIDRGDDGSSLVVEGVAAAGRTRLDAQALRRGAVLELAGRVVLILHVVPELDGQLPKYGLVGESAAIHRVRRQIAESAGLHIPVLIRGESGTGKELVARAIHTASPRAAQPYVSLNMAALNPQTAVAELFGHSRGSFTGAVQAREGYFRKADGGTIFLDEIGEAPVEVQAMLLRVLESGEVQPLGGAPARRVDVRVLAATDADLAEAILQGSFRPSLLHRLAGYEVAMPALCDRIDDIPRLLVHFLERELRRAGSPERFERLAADASTQIPTSFMVGLLRHTWPGNVRQLSNIAGRLLAALLADRDPADLDALLLEGPASRLPEFVVGTHGSPEPEATRPDDDPLDDAALLTAMRAHDWQIAATARALGIARNTLYARMRRSGQIRKARDLSRSELADVHERCAGDLPSMASALGVSLRALKLRLHELDPIP